MPTHEKKWFKVLNEIIKQKEENGDNLKNFNLSLYDVNFTSLSKVKTVPDLVPKNS